MQVGRVLPSPRSATEDTPQLSRVGTGKYMPPDGRMDIRADVYAAELVIYEMLTGLPAERSPRLGTRAREVVRQPRLQESSYFASVGH